MSVILGCSVAAFGDARPIKTVIRTRTAVMGVRGLDEIDLQNAIPDPEAVASLDRFIPTARELEGFGQFRDQKLKPVSGGAPIRLKSEDIHNEEKVGREIAATLLGGAPLVTRPEPQKYINLVGNWVAMRSDRPDLRWHFGLLASDSINAFAVPGGYVFVTLGLYQKLRSESELAGVLGHEITHIVARDHYDRIMLARAVAVATGRAKQLMQNMPMFKHLAEGAAAHAALVFTSALDQGAEVAADRQGMMLAADSGYQPFGLPQVLKVLSLLPREGRQAALLFKTHPTPADRIAAVASLMQGRFAAKAADPDMRSRFDEYDLSSMRLVRRKIAGAPANP